jgi:hypothetical protein
MGTLQHLAQQCLYVHAGAIHKVCYGGDHVGIEQHSGEGCSNEASLDSKEFRTLSS